MGAGCPRELLRADTLLAAWRAGTARLPLQMGFDETSSGWTASAKTTAMGSVSLPMAGRKGSPSPAGRQAGEGLAGFLFDFPCGLSAGVIPPLETLGVRHSLAAGQADHHRELCYVGHHQQHHGPILLLHQQNAWDGGVKWGGNMRGHELPVLPASSSPSFSVPQHGAERSTLITAS